MNMKFEQASHSLDEALASFAAGHPDDACLYLERAADILESVAGTWTPLIPQPPQREEEEALVMAA